jgi:hypothetical protein
MCSSFFLSQNDPLYLLDASSFLITCSPSIISTLPARISCIRLAAFLNPEGIYSRRVSWSTLSSN